MGTNELIGEDPPVIIRLECQPVNGLDYLSLHGDLMLYPPESCSEHVTGETSAYCAFLVRVCVAPYDCSLSDTILRLCVFTYARRMSFAGLESIAGSI